MFMQLIQYQFIKFIKMKTKELSHSISLSKWPQRSHAFTKRSLSPLTSKILILTHTNIHDLMPISLQEFIQQKLSTSNTNDIKKISQYYTEEITYRRKKLKLLQSIWNKNHSKMLQQSSSLMSSTNSLASQDLKNSLHLKPKSSKKKFKSKCELHSPKPLSIKSKKQVNQKIEKTNSPLLYKKSNKRLGKTQYFEGYQKKQRLNTDESTKSNRIISKNSKFNNRSISPNYDYYETSISKTTKKATRANNKIRYSQQENKIHKQNQKYQQLQGLLQRWTQVFEEHARELKDSKGLSQSQRKRLQKMQRIEQAEIKKEIDEICEELTKKFNYNSCV